MAARHAVEAGDRLAAPAGLSSARSQVLGVVDHGLAPAASVARIMGLTHQSMPTHGNGTASSNTPTTPTASAQS